MLGEIKRARFTRPIRFLPEIARCRQPKRAGSGLAAFTAMMVSGCSLTLSGPDPKRPIGRYPTCDSSNTLVVLDVVDGTGFGLGAVAIAGTSGKAAAVLGSIGALFYLAAYHGKGVIDDCRKEIALTKAPSEPDRSAPDADTPASVPATRSLVQPPSSAGATVAKPKRDDGHGVSAARGKVVEPPTPITPVAPPAAAPKPPVAPVAPAATDPQAEPPPVVKPAPGKPSPPAQPAPRASDDPWSAFWREVP